MWPQFPFVLFTLYYAHIDTERRFEEGLDSVLRSAFLALPTSVHEYVKKDRGRHNGINRVS